MPNETATNSASVESAPVSPSTDLNDPANLDFEDESDTQTSAPEQDAEVDPESEPDAGDETASESDESDSDEVEASDDDETEAEPKAAVKVNVPDDAIVTLPNGEEVSFADLKKSPMMQKDYSQKTQQLGNERRALAEQATRLNQTLDHVANFLAAQIPPAPEPQLAVTDPATYVQRKAMHESALLQLQSIFETATAAKAEVQQLSEADFAAARRDAAEKVAERLPFLRNPQKAQQFDKDTAEVASFIGFSPAEISKMTDPRHFLLAHYAHKGMKAEQAEKKVKAKVQEAPRVTPAAKAGAAKGNPQFLLNKEGMRALAKSGSIRDAMKIDFE